MYFIHYIFPIPGIHKHVYIQIHSYTDIEIATAIYHHQQLNIVFLSICSAIALVLKYVMRGWKKTKEDYVEDGLPDELKWLLKYLDVIETVKHASIEEGQKVAALIEEYKLVREHVPTWLLKSKEVNMFTH